jgi:hypothetical protein
MKQRYPIEKAPVHRGGASRRRRTYPAAKGLLAAMPILVLVAFMAAAVRPVGANAAPANVAALQLVAPSFSAAADAYVAQSSPASNYGSSAQLEDQGKSGTVKSSYIRFNVSGLSGTIQRATLRVYVTSHGIKNGPAAYLAGNNWAESGSGGVTWNTRPALLSGVADNKGAIAKWSWVEYNVTHLVPGNGTFTFALIADGNQDISFSSRQGSHPPQLLLSVAVNPTPTATATQAGTPTAAASPTRTPTAGAPGTIQHVFLVVMENHGYNQVWNTSASPYITSLGNSYARATNYHALTHPSLPNYLQLYAGSNYGITTDCSPSATCHSSAKSLADTLAAKGLTWKGYMESMPSPCYLTTSGTYAPKHDPFIYFDDIRTNATRCTNHVVLLSALSVDLASAATTPNYAFITPNLCNDMHDCSVSTGDTWLKNHVPTILASPACTIQRCLLVVTWDEDDGNEGNHVLTIFAGSGSQVGGVTSGVSYTHYSLLRTVEDIFGLPAQTSNDGAASPMSDLLR